MAVSLEFEEGRLAYAEGVDGYAATPYPEGTMAMADWFAGWVTAKELDDPWEPENVD